MDEPPSRSNLKDLLTAYRARFKDDPPLMGVDKDDLARRIQEALTTGQALRTEDFGVPPDAYVSATEKRWSWREGPFDPSIDNWLELYYVPQPEEPDESFIVALVYIARQDEGTGVFTVQLFPEDLPESVDQGLLANEVRLELDFFISDTEEKDPMKYLRYRATTFSNAYSQLQWAYKIYKPQPPVS